MAWAIEELTGVALGDPRLTKRLIWLVDDLSAHPTKSIPIACGGMAETKATYRLLDNAVVDWWTVLEAHGEPTVARMAREARVLCGQDTTKLDFTSQPGIAGLGRLSYERQHGMYLHPTWAVSESGMALGVLDGWMGARKPKGEADILESQRWTEGYERVAELDHPADYLIRARRDSPFLKVRLA